MSFTIPIAAALVCRADGRMLLVRKRGAFAFMQPGGKIEPGWIVQAEFFRIEVETVVHPAAEIEEIIWIVPSAPGKLNLAPLTRDHVLPLHNARLNEMPAPDNRPQLA